MTHMMCLFIQTPWKTLWSHEKTHVLVFLFAVFWRHHCGYWQVLQERVRHMGGGGGTALVVDPQGISMGKYGKSCSTTRDEPMNPTKGIARIWVCNSCSGKVEMLMNYEPTWTLLERRVTMNLACGRCFCCWSLSKTDETQSWLLDLSWFCMLTSLVRIGYQKLLAKQLRQ